MLKEVSRTRPRPQLVGADAKRQQEDQHAWREVERDMGHGLGTRDLPSYTEAAPTWLLRGSLSLAPLSALSHARGTLSLSTPAAMSPPLVFELALVACPGRGFGSGLSVCRRHHHHHHHHHFYSCCYSYLPA